VDLDIHSVIRLHCVMLNLFGTTLPYLTCKNYEKRYISLHKYIKQFVFLVQFSKITTVLLSTGTHNLDFSLRSNMKRICSCYAICFTQSWACCRSSVFCAIYEYVYCTVVPTWHHTSSPPSLRETATDSRTSAPEWKQVTSVNINM
jgi:hypothetical protein